MSISSKNHYPKAIPCHSPEELALQNSRLSKFNEELAEKTKRLSQHNEELAEKAVCLRRWTMRLVWTCLCLLLLAGGAVAFISFFPGVIFRPTPAVAAPAQQSPLPDSPNQDAKVAPPASLVKTNTPGDSMAKATLVLPSVAIGKPDAVFVAGANPTQKTGFLEALGGLSATHLYQTHLNIGLLADGVESETYTVEEAEKNLKSVVELMKLVDGQLAKVTKAGIDKEDQDSIAQIQAVNAMLRMQVDALRGYWATGDIEQAAQYHKARKAAWQGLSKVMGIDS